MRGGALLSSSIGTKRGHLDLQLHHGAQHSGLSNFTELAPNAKKERVDTERMAAPRPSHHPQERVKVLSGLLSQVHFVGYLKVVKRETEVGVSEFM